MNFIDQFFISIGLDTDGINKGIAVAENKLLSGLSGIAAKVAGPLTALFSFAAIGSMFSGMAAEMDRTAKAADAIGVAVEDLQYWGAAATLAGGSADGLSHTVDVLTRNLSRMATTGTSRAKPFLDELGIAAVDASGKTRGAFDVLEEISGKIEGMDKAKSYGLLQNMGFDKGTITLLQSGSKAVREQLRLQREIGAYSRQDAAAMEKFNDSLYLLTRTIKISLAPVFVFMADVLSKAADLISRGIRFMREHVEALIPLLILLAGVLLKTLVPAAVAAGAAIWTAMAPLLPFIAAAAALGLLLEDLAVWARGGDASFGDLWAAIFGSPEGALKAFGEIKAELKSLWEAAKEALPPIMAALKNVFGEDMKNRLRAFAKEIKLIVSLAREAAILAGQIRDVISPKSSVIGLRAKLLINPAGVAADRIRDYILGEPAAAAPAIAAGGAATNTTNNDISNEQTVTVNINAPGGDAQAIGQAAGKAVADNWNGLANAANTGVRGT